MDTSGELYEGEVAVVKLLSSKSASVVQHETEPSAPLELNAWPLFEALCQALP